MGKSKENETVELKVRRGKEQRMFDILGVVIIQNLTLQVTLH